MVSRREFVTVHQPEATLVDPNLLTDNKSHRNLLLAMFDTLVERRTAGQFDGALASGWSTSGDARVWTFHLRDGVRFHDGSTLQAADVVAALVRARDVQMDYYGTRGILPTYFQGASFGALDGNQVKVVLQEPMADLLDLLAGIPIPSRNSPTMGTGPMRLDAVEPGKIDMSANLRHWRGRPIVAGVTWQAQGDPKHRADAVQGGNLTIATDIPALLARPLSRSSVVTRTQASSLCVVLMLNMASEVIRDERVRKALNVALDRKRIAGALYDGLASNLDGPVTSRHFGYSRPDDPLAFSQTRARELLGTAGFGDGLAVTVDCPTTMPDEAPAMLELIALDYRLSGIDLTVRRHSDRREYAELVRTKVIGDACVFDSSPSSTFRVLREKLSANNRGPWWQGYDNPEFERTLALAAKTPATQARRRAYVTAIQIARRDAPWVFLWSPHRVWALAPGTPFSVREDGTLTWMA